MQTLTSNLLIAMPGMRDGNFNHSVSVICRHDEFGAMGVMINRKMHFPLSNIMEQLNIKVEATECLTRPVYFGGPVFVDRGFILHREPGKWTSCLQVEDNLYLTSSKDILEAIAVGAGPESYLISLGCAGWDEGQLEQEMIDNSWLNVPYDSRIVFETNAKMRWQESARMLGIDLSQISAVAGHA